MWRVWIKRKRSSSANRLHSSCIPHFSLSAARWALVSSLHIPKMSNSFISSQLKISFIKLINLHKRVEIKPFNIWFKCLGVCKEETNAHRAMRKSLSHYCLMIEAEERWWEKGGGCQKSFSLFVIRALYMWWECFTKILFYTVHLKKDN